MKIFLLICWILVCIYFIFIKKVVNKFEEKLERIQANGRGNDK